MTREEIYRRLESGNENLRRQTEVIEVVEPGEVYTQPESLAADDNVFRDLGYQPDAWKAYMQFALCRAFPNIAGPASVTGNYLGFTPRVLEKNHQSLIHQQINLDHRMKAYSPDAIPRDRIVGCCVATSFPRPPAGRMSWDSIPETIDEAPEITGLAALFKLAEGVNRFLGDHLSGKKRKAVSIEVTADLEHMHIYVPGSREIFSLFEAPDEMLEAVEPTDRGLILGRAVGSGEQLAWAYGGKDGVVEFRGTGIVDVPADRTARIQWVNASREGVELCAMPAARVPELLVGRQARLVKAVSGAVAEVCAVHTDGRHGPAEWKKAASNCNPLLELRLPSGHRAWWNLADVELD